MVRNLNRGPYTREYIRGEIARLEHELEIIRKALGKKKRAEATVELIAGKERQLLGFRELLERKGRNTE